MVYDSILKGRYVDLRSCTEEDAEFTLAIRQDPAFTRFLPRVNNTLEQQKAWIRQQRQKEGDYFFIVRDSEENRIGTISVYNIQGDHAECGRLAIKSDDPFHAAEATILQNRFAFDVLGLEYTYGYIFAENTRAVRFNRQFGCRFSPAEKDESGKTIVRAETRRQDFKEAEKKLRAILYREEKR